MKIRAGFVSNSSSSSFIVGLPQIPKSVEEMAEMIFGDKKTFKYEYIAETFSTKKIGKFLLNNFEFDIEKCKQELYNDIQNDILYNFKEYCEKAEYCSVIDEFGISEPTWKESERKLNEYQTKLRYAFPSIDWNKKFEIILRYVEKNLQKENNLTLEINILEEKLAEKYKCQHKFNGTQDQRNKIYELREKYILNNPEYKKLNQKRLAYHKKSWNPPNKMVCFIVHKLVAAFFKYHKNDKIGYISIADETDMGCAMEHGGIFEKFNHMRFSHH